MKASFDLHFMLFVTAGALLWYNSAAGRQTRLVLPSSGILASTLLVLLPLLSPSSRLLTRLLFQPLLLLTQSPQIIIIANRDGCLFVSPVVKVSAHKIGWISDEVRDTHIELPCGVAEQYVLSGVVW